MNCNGLHCPGCGQGPGRWLGVVIVVGCLAVIVAKAHTIEHGISELAQALAVVALTAVCAALVAAAVVVAARYRRSVIRHRTAGRAAVAALPVVIRQLGPAERPAIERPGSNGHPLTCTCYPCDLWWDTAAATIAHLEAAGQPVPVALEHAALRQARRTAGGNR